MKFVYPPTSLSLRGSPSHGPGSERVGPNQNAKSKHMRVPGFRVEGQPITGKAKNADCCKQHVSFFAPSFWLQPIRDEPKNQAPSGRAFKKDISRHARLKNRESFIIADFGLISVAVGTANRGRRRNARPSLPSGCPRRFAESWEISHNYIAHSAQHKAQASERHARSRNERRETKHHRQGNEICLPTHLPLPPRLAKTWAGLGARRTSSKF